MIIPRHKVCDLCGQEVGVNVRFYIIKSECLYTNGIDSCYDNQKHHICEDCMGEIKEKILSNNREGVDTDTYITKEDYEYNKKKHKWVLKR